MTFGSLFAGIGGFDLGLERAGMECKWQVEIDDYARRVLAKHWPDVRRWDDVRTFPPEGDWSVDLICGGFPCQDISNAGKRAGIDGERSGLWSEFARIVRVLRPSYVVVENVSALLARGMGAVLGELATSGFDAEWEIISAASIGAPHLRERIFIVAHAPQLFSDGSHPFSELGNCRDHENLADTDITRLEVRQDRERLREFAATVGSCQWGAEPAVGRVANGIPSRVDRLRCLGNAVVPQVAEYIGRRILEAT